MERKLLFVASTQGHLLHFHLPYLRALKEQGWIIHTACGGEAVIPHADHSLSLPFEKKLFACGNFRAAALLRKAVKAERYDLMIAHTSLAAFFSRLALLGLKHRPRVVNMVHGYLFDDQTSPLKMALLLGAEKVTAPVTDLILTMNHWDHEAAQKHHLGKRIAAIPGIGVDFSRLDLQKDSTLRAELGIPQDSFVLIYPAEFSARKSQSVLLHAMTLLPDHAILILPGSGVLLDSCKALAQQIGISHRVIFPGYLTEMGKWYAAADAAVSASRIEGLPFNVMEAMYCGLPVVASEVKGHTDLIRNGENGLLYPYGDHKACAEQISRLISSPDSLHRMGEQGYADAEAYALEQVFPQVMEQYESMMGIPTMK